MRYLVFFTVPKKSMFSRLLEVLSSDRPTKFQDRLVVTASIFLQIIVHAVALLFAENLETARETCFTNPLRIPHVDVSSLLVNG